LQPDDTGAATAGVHHGAMGKLTAVRGAAKKGEDERLPDLKPWREVGWIFKDGEAVVIEREADELRVREVEL
jgi:hypothetical protein